MTISTYCITICILFGICFRSFESANTVGKFVVYISVSKAEVMTINITRFALRFELVLFARIISISGLGVLILS